MSRFILGKMLFINKNPEPVQSETMPEIIINEPVNLYPRISKVKKNNINDIKKTVYKKDFLITIDDILKIKKLKKNEFLPKNIILSKILENDNVENINKMINDISMTDDKFIIYSEFNKFKNIIKDIDINLSDSESDVQQFNNVNDIYIKKVLNEKDKTNMLISSINTDSPYLKKSTNKPSESSFDRDTLLSSYSKFKPPPKNKSIVEISQNIDEMINNSINNTITDSFSSKLLLWDD